MSAETPLTPDPTLDKLARFSPAPSGFDRDELLFQAGRASVRPGRGWQVALALLVLTQTLTLGMWLLRPSQPAPPQPEVVADQAAPPPPVTVPALEPSSYGALVRWDGDTLPPVADTSPAEPNSPVLSVADGHRQHGLE
jgi:hypothetical protein